MSLTEKQRARMERVMKVAQKKQKWKDKATQGGGGGTGGTASGRQAPFVSGGSGVTLQAVQYFKVAFRKPLREHCFWPVQLEDQGVDLRP